MQSTRSFWIQNCRSENRGVFVTVLILAILIGTILFAYAAFGPEDDNRSLKQIAIIFRHGARNPTETYKNDPWITHEWDDSWGSLTKEGMKQEYNLGKWIKKNYGSFIGNKFKSTSVLIQSSYADRCIMSAQSLLASLFKPENKDLFIDDLPWRPVPVHSIPREQDKLITVKYPCPKLQTALEEAYANESKLSTENMTSYYNELSYHTGENIKTITDVEFIYNTLEIEDKQGLKLPDWTKKYYNENMKKIAAQSLAIFTSNKIQRRLRGGPLLKEITDNMMRSQNGKDKIKLYLYSAHDITLVNVLRAMGFTEELFKPDYGAAIIFELILSEDKVDHEPSQYNIKVKYLNNTNSEKAVALKIPGCKEQCKLLDLLHAWKEILPSDWVSECNL